MLRIRTALARLTAKWLGRAETHGSAGPTATHAEDNHETLSPGRRAVRAREPQNRRVEIIIR